MRSLKFPKMFNSTVTNVWSSADYTKATAQNAVLLLNTERGEQYGDPYIGCKLKGLTFNQNNYVLDDALKDVIYDQMALFIPQVKFKRSDITIDRDSTKGKVYVTVKGVSQIDYTIVTYNLQVFDQSDM